MNSKKILSELEEILSSSSSDLSKISNEKILECYSSIDIDVLGACYVLITEQRFVKRIFPELKKNETEDFIRRYLEKCLLENPDSEWANSRYEAGWDIANWINTAIKAHGSNSVEVRLWMTWIERIHLEGNRDVRVCIETAVFEHLDELKLVSKYLLAPTL